MKRREIKLKIERLFGIPDDELICCKCLNVVEKRGLSKCCNEIVSTPRELREIDSGKIPVIEFRQEPRNKSIKRKDMVTGIRKGTKKYSCYKLWKEGLSPTQIFDSLKESGGNPNISSIRSWVGKFKVRYAIGG